MKDYKRNTAKNFFRKRIKNNFLAFTRKLYKPALAIVIFQFIGVVSYGLFALVASFIVWFIIKAIIGIRASKDDEEYGLDMSELGTVSFPDFTKK